jgi:predicted RNA-binding Zn-ribbon protein involved in translation (DUF1610 family)
MTITSKYPGTCRSCGGRIRVGERVNWQRGQGASHIACPEDAPPAAKVTVDKPGVFERPDGEVFIVKFNKQKTNLYASRMVEINAERATEDGGRAQVEFEYDRGAIYTLEESMRMGLEKAKALSIRYRRCIMCGYRLKAAESVERGVGPVCVKKIEGRS